MHTYIHTHAHWCRLVNILVFLTSCSMFRAKATAATRACIYACMCVCMYVCMYIYISEAGTGWNTLSEKETKWSEKMHACMYEFAYICAYMYAYMYMCTCMCMCMCMSRRDAWSGAPHLHLGRQPLCIGRAPAQHTLVSIICTVFPSFMLLASVLVFVVHAYVYVYVFMHASA